MTHRFVEYLRQINSVPWDEFRDLDLGGIRVHPHNDIMVHLKWSALSDQLTRPNAPLPAFVHSGTAEDLTQRIEQFRAKFIGNAFARSQGIKLNGEIEFMPLLTQGQSRKEEPFALIRRDFAALMAAPVDSVKDRIDSRDKTGKRYHWLGRVLKGKHQGKLDLSGGGWPFGIGRKNDEWKEAGEEFGIEEKDILSRQKAGYVSGTLSCYGGYGVSVKTIYCSILEVPHDFKPNSRDHSMLSFERYTTKQLIEMLARPENFKPTAYLALLGTFVADGTIRQRQAHEPKPENLYGKLTLLEPEDYKDLVQALHTKPPEMPLAVADVTLLEAHRVKRAIRNPERFLKELAA